MKRLIPAALVIMLLITASAAVFAQELKLSGEAKTGIFWEQQQYQGKPTEQLKEPLRLHSKDDAGSGQGRFRLNLDFDGGKNFGMRGRLDWENWSNTENEQPKWKYAFAYGNFFDEQLTVAVGKLGGSPWGTGGPEKWKELEQNNNGGGMRVEWKPGFIPEKFGKLNMGFVLNYLNSYDDSGAKRTGGFLDLLQESVLGAAYTHNLFMIRFAYRLDSDLDIRIRGTEQYVEQYGSEGGDFIYRIEEYILRQYLPGMQMWALGVYEGVFAGHPMFYKFENWIFGQYEPDELFGLSTPFTAQIRLGYDYIDQRSEFHVKPSFYWNFFSKLLSVGAMFSYRQDFGNKIWAGSPYQQIELEPKIQLNFTSSYIAFAYNWKQEYTQHYEERGNKDPIKRTQYINLRFCIYY